MVSAQLTVFQSQTRSSETPSVSAQISVASRSLPGLSQASSMCRALPALSQFQTSLSNQTPSTQIRLQERKSVKMITRMFSTYLVDGSWPN